jgi:hypothetical protein
MSAVMGLTTELGIMNMEWKSLLVLLYIIVDVLEEYRWTVIGLNGTGDMA